MKYISPLKKLPKWIQQIIFESTEQDKLFPYFLYRILERSKVPEIEKISTEFIDDKENCYFRVSSPEALLIILIYELYFQYRKGHLCLNQNLFTNNNGKVFLYTKNESEVQKVHLKIEKYPEMLLSLLKNYPEVISEEKANNDSIIFKQYNSFYLNRNYKLEQNLYSQIMQRVNADNIENIQVSGRIGSKLAEIDQNCNFTANFSRNIQLEAVFLASIKRFLIISGGPGTGKTTIISRILALAASESKNIKVKIAAPTGKAANRLNDSLLGSDHFVKFVQPVYSDIEAKTIHRVLGPVKNSRNFIYDKYNKLDCDLFILDECSMVDAEMMLKVLEALKDDCRIILLGDRYQLASVEAGAVFADLCEALAQKSYNSQEYSYLSDCLKSYFKQDQALLPDPNEECLGANLINLIKSYRFPEDSEVGMLAKAIILGNIELFKKLFTSDLETISFIHLDFLTNEKSGYKEKQVNLKNFLKPFYLGFFKELKEKSNLTDSERIIDLLERLKESVILSPVKNGLTGVNNLNKIFLEISECGKQNPYPVKDDKFFAGLPLLINTNDYNSGLFNGDLGIVVKEKGNDFLTACFAGSENQVIKFQTGLLPDNNPAYALTIHKSQGSEYKNILIMIPGEINPLLTRELLYTAITRFKYQKGESKKRLFIAYGNEDVLFDMIKQKNIRYSNLKYRIEARI